MTTITDFQVLSKLGTVTFFLTYEGSGSFSDVYRVRRLSDGLEYALKKVYLLLSERNR